VVLDGYAARRMIRRLQSRSRLSYVYRFPTPAQRYTQEEVRRGVREDGDPAIRGLYRLVLGLPTPSPRSVSLALYEAQHLLSLPNPQLEVLNVSFKGANLALLICGSVEPH
jgi:hypothetical protein